VKKRTRIIAMALVLALTAASIYAFANTIPSSGTTTIVPNRLTVAWDGEDGTPITIDTFRFFGYNVAQLRTMVNVLEGTVTNNADGTFQIRDSGAPVSFQDIGFNVSTEIQYIINNTRIRNNAGQLFTPAQPGWVFLPAYEYNWASVRDIIASMDLVLVDFTDDPAAGTTEVIVARREANDQQNERPPSGPAVNRPGNDRGNWRDPWRTTPPHLTVTPAPSPTPGPGNNVFADLNLVVENAATGDRISGAALTLLTPTSRTAETNDNGEYTFTQVPANDIFILQVVRPGFMNASFAVQAIPSGPDFVVALVPDEFAGEEGILSGSVLNATTGVAITGGATVEIRQGSITGSPIHSVSTAANGGFEFPALDSGNYIISVLSNGFITYHLNVLILNDDIVIQPPVLMSPELEDESFRVVLSWGSSPADLDAHLRGPHPAGANRFHVYYANRSFQHGGAVQAILDIDVQNGFGPETITINELANGRYEYFVHDFTNRANAASTALRNSGATVRVYNNSGLYRTFNVPTTGTGNVWHVFSIQVVNGQPTVIPSNAALSHQSNPANVGL